MSNYYWVVSTEGYLCARIMVIGGGGYICLIMEIMEDQCKWSFNGISQILMIIMN